MGEIITFPVNSTNFTGHSISEKGELDAHFESQIEAQEQQSLEQGKTPHYNWFVRKYPQYFLHPSEILELLESQRSLEANDNIVIQQEAA